MRKFISLLLVFCMIFTMNTAVFADDLESNVLRTSTGTYYCYSEPYNGDIWEVILYHPDNSNILEFTTKPHNSEMIYSTEITGTNPQGLKIEEILAEITLQQREASVVNISDCVSSDTISTRTAVEGSMRRELEKIYGYEYSGRVLTTYNNSSFPKVSRIQVKEDLFFRFDPNSSLEFWFNAGTSISSVALTIFGIATPEIIELISGLLGVSDTLQQGVGIEKHTAIANYGRYCYINGGSRIYNDTYKFYNHVALDIEGQDEVTLADAELRYSDSASYFNSYYQQASDAYNSYI